jgi:hypothetical protein
MRELAEQARERREAEGAEEGRRKEERDAKLRRSQEEKAGREERLARERARRRWLSGGGTEEEFEQEWPGMRTEILRRHTIEDDANARLAQRRSGISNL